MKSFQDKVAVITGAGSGLGRAFAVQLHSKGARLALCDLDLPGLKETYQLTGEKRDRITLHQVDVSNPGAVSDFAAEVLTQHGGADLLINNAGISLTPLPFEEISEEQCKNVLDVNLWGVYHNTRAFLSQLKTKAEAGIINISSLAGLVGLYGYSAYSMSKSALRGFSEALSCELAGSNISVLLAHPGGVKTNLIKNAPNLGEDQRETAHANFTQFATLDPDRAAQIILKAFKRKRNRIILGLDAHFIYGIRKLFPGSYPKIIKNIFSPVNFKDSFDWRKSRPGE